MHDCPLRPKSTTADDSVDTHVNNLTRNAQNLNIKESEILQHTKKLTNQEVAQVMDSLPREVLVTIHAFAAPAALPKSNAAGQAGQAALPGQKGPILELEPVRSALAWVAHLRRVCRQWRDTLDDPKALIWFYTANAMGLEPPMQLYSGGTYGDVCKLLLETERQKQQATDEAARTPRHSYMCGMRMPPRELEAHPNPQRPMVTLPQDLVQRVAENAKALETFLKSFDFAVLMNGSGDSKDHKRWHESALIRYRMFLYLRKSHPSVWLVPTADIEFCWLAHIFRTGAYWNDITELGIKPDHGLCLSYGEVATFSQAVEATQSLWNKTFGPNYPDLPPGTDTSWRVWNVERQSIMHAARACRKDPRSFFPTMGPEILVPPNTVVLPNIHLTAPEVKADLSYERFLNLCNQKNTDFSPPHVLDLIWHAHQMEPQRYKEDCLSLFGREFRHEPWPNGLGVSSPLTQEFECAWKQEYGTPIAEDWKYYLGESTAEGTRHGRRFNPGRHGMDPRLL